MGFTLRSFFPHERFSMRFRTEEPTYRFTSRYSRPKTSRLAKLRFLGFDPPERPVPADARLTRRLPVAPLGFALPRQSGEDLVRDFARTPLTRLSGGQVRRPETVMRHRVSISLRLTSSGLLASCFNPDEAALIGFPRQFRSRPFGLRRFRAMSSPHAAPHIAAD
jgi:hypothetical protein